MISKNKLELEQKFVWDVNDISGLLLLLIFILSISMKSSTLSSFAAQLGVWDIFHYS